MILPICDKYQLKLQSTGGWSIQEPAKDKDGKPVWTSRLYPGSLENTIKRLALLKLSQADSKTLDEGLSEIDRVSKQLSDALSVNLKLGGGTLEIKL